MFEEIKNTQPDSDLLNKYEKLKSLIASYGSAAAAFSGGVDSAFLLYAAKEALGDKALAITASAVAFPEREINDAKEFCSVNGIRHIVFNVDQLAIEGFAENPVNRCYICKNELFGGIIQIAKEQGINVILEGSNLDDEGDYRPGLQAIKELKVKSPLRECGFTKKEIRILSNYLNLKTWNKQSFACLASRFPYGQTISAENLSMIDRAEQYLLDLGFEQLRVRIHGTVARIELLPEDIERFLVEELRLKVNSYFKDLGFSYAALDLQGYRTGSLNESIKSRTKR